MLRFITAATLAEVIRLRRELHEAQVRTNAGRQIWRDFGAAWDPSTVTPEESTFKEFLFGLSPGRAPGLAGSLLVGH